jgi:hypothetical protein
MLRDCLCDIIVLNVHASTEDKIDDMKFRFYEELEHVFHKFPKYHVKILLGNFYVEVGREYSFQPTIGKENLHEISNDSRVRVVNFAHPKVLLSKVQCSHNVTLINLLGHFLMGRRTTKLTIL